MSKKVYVGNLPFKYRNHDLKDLFSKFGEIEDVIVITDRFTRRSKGFGFVTFVNDADADKAIAEMHEKDADGRPLTVNEAKPREESTEEKPREEAPKEVESLGGTDSEAAREPEAVSKDLE
jgi:cold-inducible RNA-binding protein